MGPILTYPKTFPMTIEFGTIPYEASDIDEVEGNHHLKGSKANYIQKDYQI
jgi:hypothetical protein